MRRNPLVSAWLILGVLFLAGQSWGVCPEDPNDHGACDTLHVDIWPGDEEAWPPWPNFARFPIRVTNDIPDPAIDSVAGFVIPLCYTHTNPAKYCSLSSYWNNTNLPPSGDLDHSIFRHLPDMATAEDSNWMMLFSQSPYIPWDTRILDLDGTSHFWLSLVPTGTADQRFPGGVRSLTATMTFKMEDTMTVCIDSCAWPPMAYLCFSRSDAVTYRPRHQMPLCQYVGYYFPSIWMTCPSDQTHSTNGEFSAGAFTASHDDGTIIAADVSFGGEGVENVRIVNLSGLHTAYVDGEVVYDVTDHCAAGGVITVSVWDDLGQKVDCSFDVFLANNPPAVNLPPTWRALAGYTMGLLVSATDSDDDEVTGIDLEGFWYEPDSLQPPVNSPTFDGENPGLFSWAPTETETGTWIALFTATDACDDSYSCDISIEVGTLYCGDCNADGEINLADVVYLVADLFKDGPPPDPICRGDSNCSGVRDVGDVVLLINYLFKYGQAPCFECCP